MLYDWKRSSTVRIGDMVAGARESGGLPLLAVFEHPAIPISVAVPIT
jgi:hypothetical protein